MRLKSLVLDVWFLVVVLSEQLVVAVLVPALVLALVLVMVLVLVLNMRLLA